MATVLNLEDNLVTFVQSVTADTMLKSSLRDEEGNQVLASPLVTCGFIPSYLTGETDIQVIPHVVVQFSVADYTFERSSYAVELLISTFDQELDHQGYRDGVNLAEKLKTAIFQKRILAKNWRLVAPFNFRVIHVEQNSTRAPEHPIYRVVMLTTWENASPVPFLGDLIA